jgi:hypothetical protein
MIPMIFTGVFKTFPGFSFAWFFVEMQIPAVAGIFYFFCREGILFNE